MGTAGAVYRRASRGLPVAAEIVCPKTPVRAPGTRRLPLTLDHRAKKARAMRQIAKVLYKDVRRYEHHWTPVQLDIHRDRE
jgi:hypothetical protein